MWDVGRHSQMGMVFTSSYIPGHSRLHRASKNVRQNDKYDLNNPTG